MEALKAALLVTVTGLAVAFFRGQALLGQEQAELQTVINYISDAHKQKKGSLSRSLVVDANGLLACSDRPCIRTWGRISLLLHTSIAHYLSRIEGTATLS
jgi:hypothetical protein